MFSLFWPTLHEILHDSKQVLANSTFILWHGLKWFVSRAWSGCPFFKSLFFCYFLFALRHFETFWEVWDRTRGRSWACQELTAQETCWRKAWKANHPKQSVGQVHSKAQERSQPGHAQCLILSSCTRQWTRPRPEAVFSNSVGAIAGTWCFPI